MAAILGWGFMLSGLGVFLTTLADGHVLGCGGVDPSACLPVLGNFWILVRPTGVSFFVLCFGLIMIWREKRFRIPALGFLFLGAIYFYKVLLTFPKFC
jgi:hypothetical protein